MIRALIGKELRQHSITFSFLFVVLIAALVLISDVWKRVGGGGLDAVRILQMTYVPIACLVLGQVLVATEFRHKTQLFLEGLPLPRWRMLGVKFALGLGLILLAVTAALATAWWRTRGAEAMTPRFVALLAAKSAGWAWFLFSLCFAHAFLGRYRMAIGVLIGVTLAILASRGVPVSAFGPFALVDDRYAFERFVIPTDALAVTAALSVALSGLGFALGLVRDSTVAAMLAEKMSAREKLFLAFLTLIALMTTGYLFERYQQSTPVHIPGAIERQQGLARITASAAVDHPQSAEQAALEREATQLAKELAAVAEYLRCRSFPAIFVVHRRDLAAGTIEDGELKHAQGVMARVNVTAPGFDHPALLRWLIDKALLAHSNGVAGRERNAWVHDGFPVWWTLAPDSAGLRVTDAATLEAAARAMPADFSQHDLRAWFALRDEGREKDAAALAAAGIASLEQQHGADSCRQFLSAMLGQPRSRDVRGWLGDIVQPAPARFRAAAGEDERVFMERWRASIPAGKKSAPVKP